MTAQLGPSQRAPIPPAGTIVQAVVERTFARLGRNRRLSKDYERLCGTTETWIYLAMTRLMLRRLAAA
ncbi:transposase [Phenylobacterium sp.]|uniref:transposase n=1 Tax=Phenylobacterium sp. TaxID=1871053 RepID=UPI0039C97542